MRILHIPRILRIHASERHDPSPDPNPTPHAIRYTRIAEAVVLVLLTCTLKFVIPFLGECKAHES